MSHSRGRHRKRRVPSGPLLSLTSAVVAASITAGAGAAFAVPEQGGTSPGDTAPGQGGTSPSDVSPDGGAGAEATVEPVVVPGPGSIPGPPVEAPYQAYTAPGSYSYDEPYTPLINNRVAPRVAPPVRPIAPPPEKIRVGNFVTDIPEGMSKRDVNSINAWSAYGEAKIAQGLISAGVPEDEATRRAAATIIGVMAGGTVAVPVRRDHPLVDAPGALNFHVLLDREQRGEAVLLPVGEQVRSGVQGPASRVEGIAGPAAVATGAAALAHTAAGGPWPSPLLVALCLALVLSGRRLRRLLATFFDR